MKIRFYNTPNSWWYINAEFGFDTRTKHRYFIDYVKYFKIEVFGKSMIIWWGKNSTFIV